MKKVLSIFVLVLLSLYASGEPVGKERAFQIAHNFLARNTTKSGYIKLVEIDYDKFPNTKSGKTSDIPFYIINNENGGFVIVSNHTSSSPILAYSFENKFESGPMPEGLRLWIEGQAEAVLMQKDEEPTSQIKLKWNDHAYPTKSNQDMPKQTKLTTAQWGQHSPYNNYCPTRNGKKAPTGCLPTAVAIVMRFWEWPKAGSGYIPVYYYDPVNGNGYGQHKPDGVDVIEGGGYNLGHEYHWEDMPLSSPMEEDYTSEQESAVATLLKDCGAIVGITYTENASGAPFNNAKFLYKYMNYDAGFRLEQAHCTSWDQWISTLESEISAGRPILMSGFNDSNVGHAYVADGFDENHYISYNWGWDGTFNGFFSMEHPALNNSRIPDYFSSQQAWIGLQPNKNNPPQYSIAWSDGSSYLSIREKDYDFSNPFTLCNIHLLTENPFYYNTGDYIGDIRACTFDSEGNLKEFISSSEPVYHMRVFDEISCRITKPIEVGDYITLVFKCLGGTEWMPIQDLQHQRNTVIYLKETSSLDELTSIEIFPNVETRPVGDFHATVSKLLTLRTMNNTSFRLYDENGILCKSLYVDNGELIWYYNYEGDYISQKDMIVHIYLSSLPSGTYTIVLDHSLQHKEIKFTI